VAPDFPPVRRSFFGGGRRSIFTADEERWGAFTSLGKVRSAETDR
jgi:hypothetical protein